MKNSKKIIILGVFVSLMLIVGNIWYQANPQLHTGGKVVGEYRRDFIESFGTNQAYEVGVNKFGMPIFKDPRAAFKQIKADCSDGIREIDKQFDVGKLSFWNWKLYGIYGDQLEGFSNSDNLKKQGNMISGFFDIYENSFMTE